MTGLDYEFLFHFLCLLIILFALGMTLATLII